MAVWKVGFALLFAASLLPADMPGVRLFTTDDGLARNWVKRIRRDSKGRLWFCTVEGLSLYDGQNFSNYGVSDGLPHRLVLDILDAGDGTYWIATAAGVARFRPRTARGIEFEAVAGRPGTKDWDAATLLRGRNGDIWCATDKGLFQIRSGPRPVAVPAPLGALRTEARFYAIAEGEDGSLWLGMAHELARRRPDGSVTLWNFKSNDEPAVKAVLIDREGTLWAGGYTGLYTLDTRTESPKLKEFPASGSITGVIQSIFQDREGQIWIGALGVFRLEAGNPARPVRMFDPHSDLGSQFVADLTDDLAGNIWIGSGSIGAARLTKAGFTQFSEADGLESRTVQSVFETPEGVLLAVSGEKHTLNEFDGSRFRAIRPLAPGISDWGWGEDRIALESRSGEWWVATGTGLLRYPRVSHVVALEGTRPKAMYGTAEGLPDVAVTRLFEDSEGDIWIGTGSGVARYHTRTGTIENLSHEFQAALGHDAIPLAFAEDRSGAIWAGFYQDGLVRYRGGRLEKIRAAPAGTIRALLVDRVGRLWIASGAQGLARIDDPAASTPPIRFFTEAQGVRGRQLYALAEDRSGRIYAAGGYGVDRINPESGFTAHFMATAGLPEGETRRMFRDHQGNIWFASDFGLSRYEPEPDSTAAPAAPTIREVKVSGITVLRADDEPAQTAPLAIPSNKDSLEITYGSVDFAGGSSVRYRYRLRPIQSEWRTATEARSVQYAGIGSGEYQFEVQAVGASGAVSAGAASFDFRIAAPFWKTWWFLAFTGLVVAGLMLVAHLYRVSHLVGLERMRVHLAADLHDNLGAGLTEIAILSEVAKQERSTRSLDEVADRARELRSTMGDIVWSVDPECDDLECLIRRWRQVAFALIGNENLDFSSPPEAETAGVPVPPDRRRHLIFLFKEVLTNVARHSGAEHVRVTVRRETSALMIEIEDNGCGFDAAERKGRSGLKNMQMRAEALQAELNIISGLGKGTRVSVRTPI